MFSTLVPPSEQCLWGRRVHWALLEEGSVSSRSSDRQPGTHPELFPGPPLALNFASSPFHTLYQCFTMGVVLATCQVLGTPPEQERHTSAVPFFPLGSVFLTSEESVLRLDGWTLSYPISTAWGSA